MTYSDYFRRHLTQLKEEGRYRVFIDLERPSQQAPYALWRHEKGVDKVVVWCSNDYLSMTHHPHVMEAFQKGAQAYGVGAGGTRNISGTAHAHVQLEQTVADLHNKEAGLIFSSGYCANEAAISALAMNLPNCLVLSDEKNHASVIQGIRNSRAQKQVFSHNDMDDLEEKLKQQDVNRAKIVIVTSIYSMDGDRAPLCDVAFLCKKYKALSYVDEVHAVGLYGPTGAGLLSELGLEDHIDVIQGNFAKAYGVVGGYIAARADLIDYVRSCAAGFIFTTSLPPAVALAAQASVTFLKEESEIRARFWENVKYLKNQLAKTSLPVIQNDGHIVPILVGGAVCCKNISDVLLEKYKIYVQPINYPTVKKGQERLRLTVTPAHTHQHIDQLVKALQEIFSGHQALKTMAA